MVRTYKAIIEIDDDECASASASGVQRGITNKGAVITSWEDVTPAQTVAAPVEARMVAVGPMAAEDMPWPSFLPKVSEAPKWARWMAVDADKRAWWWEREPYNREVCEWNSESGNWAFSEYVDLPKNIRWTMACWRIPGK
jgi:hypothetical protein